MLCQAFFTIRCEPGELSLPYPAFAEERFCPRLPIYAVLDRLVPLDLDCSVQAGVVYRRGSVKISTLSGIFKALKDGNVRYLVAGGLAVVAHGYLRFTADIDVILEMDTKNLQAAVGVFKNFGYQPRAPVGIEEFADPGKREQWVREKGLTVFSLWSPDHIATEIDLFIEEPFAFEEAYQRRMQFKIAEGVEATIISLDDLITLKKQAGRARDLHDIERLEAIREGLR